MEYQLEHTPRHGQCIYVCTYIQTAWRKFLEGLKFAIYMIRSNLWNYNFIKCSPLKGIRLILNKIAKILTTKSSILNAVVKLSHYTVRMYICMYVPAVAQCSLADVRWPRSSENCPGCIILLWDLDGRWSTPVLHPPPKAHCSPTPHVEGGVVRTKIRVHKRVTTLCGMIVMHIVTIISILPFVI